jgi:hypothetical protein
MLTRLAAILLLGCLLAPIPQVSADLNADVQSAPPEKQLAFLDNPNSDWYHLDPMVVARFKSLLGQLSHEYNATPKDIANWTVKAQGVLEEEGIPETLLSIMEAVNRIAVGLGPDFNATYHDMAVAYITLRIKGFSGQEAIDGIHELYMGIIATKPSKKANR